MSPPDILAGDGIVAAPGLPYRSIWVLLIAFCAEVREVGSLHGGMDVKVDLAKLAVFWVSDEGCVAIFIVEPTVLD